MRHPTGLYILFFTEMWERFSYYGMRALLLLYMTESLHYATHTAAAIYGAYTALAYITPIVGGYIADRFWGQQRSIMLGGSLMALGHFLMVWPSTAAFAGALALLVVGNGFFKPNISVIVGRLYSDDDPRRDGAFSLFYMGINLGAFLSPLICGTLGQRVGWHYGFGAAGIGMLLGLGLFAMGRHHLGTHGLRATSDSLGAAGRPPLTRAAWQRLAVVAVLAIFGNIIFWAAFEQAGSSLTLFAEQSTDLTVAGSHWQMPSSWFQAANPLYIALMAPLFSWFWVALQRRGHEPSTPAKFAVGLALLAVGFYTMVCAGQRVDAGQTVGMGWLCATYFFNTCGELCISPVGLSAVTKLAPPRLASLVMGLWFGSMAIANAIGGDYAGSYETMGKAAFFRLPMVMASIAAVVLMLLVRPLRRMMHGIS
jgi:POT family proton-dependent oligopeptide transporter